MHIETKTTWKHAEIDGVSYQFAPTSDPRVLAVIQQDEESGGGHIDGDCYAPAFYYDRNNASISKAGSTYMDPESEGIAERLVEARNRFLASRIPSPTIARYAWIFHRSAFVEVSSTIHQDSNVIIISTPSFREHVGIESESRKDSQSCISGDEQDWSNALDGEVYGVGWAVNPSQVMPPSGDIDLEDYTIDIECWGSIGEEYARSEAAAFAHGKPDLEELLDFGDGA